MEHNVQQRSQEWYELRRGMVVTGSRFADAIGAGKGRPYDFLKSLFNTDDDAVDNEFTRQGIEMEPVIHEAYDLLTGHTTRESGFWTITEEDPLKDALVVDPVTGKLTGVCEFKAPLYSMYRDIPKQYLVQMHGHMAVTGSLWCDFMAVCKARREIMLKRVHFCPQFWKFIANKLQQFCMAYNEFNSDSGTANSKYIEIVKQWSVNTQLPFENKIQVTDLLQRCKRSEEFCGLSGHAFKFDFLMSSYVVNGSEPRSVNFDEDIQRLDDMIEEDKNLEEAMLAFPC